MKVKFIYIILILMVMVAACARPPVADMEAAREAVFRAENNPDAAQYAANSLARAREALRRMQEEADAKRYDSAKAFAAEAVAAAEKAVTDGRAGAARARAEAESLVAALQSDVKEANRNVNGARYSELDLDYDALERELAGAYDGVGRAEGALAHGDYQGAMDSARQARSDIFSINQTVADAVPRSKK